MLFPRALSKSVCHPAQGITRAIERGRQILLSYCADEIVEQQVRYLPHAFRAAGIVSHDDVALGVDGRSDDRCVSDIESGRCALLRGQTRHVSVHLHNIYPIAVEEELHLCQLPFVVISDWPNEQLKFGDHGDGSAFRSIPDFLKQLADECSVRFGPLEVIDDCIRIKTNSPRGV